MSLIRLKIQREELTGTVENLDAGGSVSVDVADETLTAEVDNGNWSVTLTAEQVAALASPSAITVTAVDSVGNQALAVSQSVSKDLTAPVVTVDAIADDGIINDSESQTNLTVTGTASDADGETITVTLNDQTYQAVVDGETWQIEIPSEDLQQLPETSQLAVNISDSAGNAAEPITQEVTYQTTLPTCALIPLLKMM